MSDWGGNVEGLLVHRLEDCGFVLEAGERRGDYIVEAYRGSGFPRRPKLSLPNALVVQHLERMSEDLRDNADPAGEALDLVSIHIEEGLLASVNGENYTTAVGVRRGAGGEVNWFVEKDEPASEDYLVESCGDLEWRAEPPGGR